MSDQNKAHDKPRPKAKGVARRPIKRAAKKKKK